MFIEDLSTHAYFAHGGNVRAVGWLEAGHSFPRGPVAHEFLAVLKEHVAKACQPVNFMGEHHCILCDEGPPPWKSRKGHRNLLVPTAGLLYVAPELVVHYIEDHGYQPPVEFVAAVLACPEQQSAAYFDLLRPFEPSWLGNEEMRYAVPDLGMEYSVLLPEGTCCIVRELPPSGSQEWGKVHLFGGATLICGDDGGEEECNAGGSDGNVIIETSPQDGNQISQAAGETATATAVRAATLCMFGFFLDRQLNWMPWLSVSSAALGLLFLVARIFRRSKVRSEA